MKKIIDNFRKTEASLYAIIVPEFTFLRPTVLVILCFYASFLLFCITVYIYLIASPVQVSMPRNK